MSNNKQKTAVEWLYDELTKVWYDVKSSKELLNQAKEMHRQEIINAVDGYPIANRYLDGNEYYEQTYGGNK